MDSRHVDRVVKDGRDDITHLEGSWGSVSSEVARDQIGRHLVAYFACVDGAVMAPVMVRRGWTDNFLFASWDGTGKNGLDLLVN